MIKMRRGQSVTQTSSLLPLAKLPGRVDERWCAVMKHLTVVSFWGGGVAESDSVVTNFKFK